MKLSQGFTRLVPSLLLLLFYGLSFGAMALAIKRIEVSRLTPSGRDWEPL